MKAAAIILVVICSFATGQTTWYVDASATGPGAGTQANPFTSIQAGVNAAANGDTVLVLPGIYVEMVNYMGRAVVVRSLAGPTLTTISASNLGTAVLFPQAAPGLSALVGFTVRDGVGDSGRAGGIHSEGASPIIANCVVRNNIGLDGAAGTIGPGNIGGAGSPGGISLLPGPPVPFVVGCVVAQNSGGDGGPGAPGGCSPGGFPGPGGPGGVGGIYCPTGAYIEHCVIWQNAGGVGGAAGSSASPGCNAPNGAPGPGGLGSTAATVRNTIVWADSTPQFSGAVAWENCNVMGGPVGPGGIAANPMLLDWVGHIHPSSPCVDAGATNTAFPFSFDIDGDPRVFHGAADMGVDETILSQFPSQSGPGAPTSFTNYNLTPGTEYYNLFTFGTCGPTAIQVPQLGICGDFNALLSQFNSPLGTPFHFIANADTMAWGPYQLPPATVTGVCFEWVGGSLGFVSRPVQFVVQ